IEAQLSDTSIYEEANKARLQELLAEQAQLQPQLLERGENWLLVSGEIEAARSRMNRLHNKAGHLLPGFFIAAALRRLRQVLLTHVSPVIRRQYRGYGRLG